MTDRPTGIDGASGCFRPSAHGVSDEEKRQKTEDEHNQKTEDVINITKSKLIYRERESQN